MTILWEVGEPQPNPFEAIAGDLTEYVVHYASSESTTENNVISELHECIDRAIDLNEIGRPPNCDLVAAFCLAESEKPYELL
ncbi:hypothetical protein OAP14_11290 [Aliiglaciecola sp.]|nr:hypothetical protein [Aliiglaciecola sp.]